jgi:transglutaminase-like putative cysteine protease
MKLLLESNDLNDYLLETEELDFSHFIIREKLGELFNESQNEIETVKIAFEFVRDQIAHSWDIKSTRITRKASEVLIYKEGICYAKSNLLASILRATKIPTGFCYQRLTIGNTPDTGYCIHALNAVYLSTLGRWIRLDARGNKTGINTQFSLYEEKLAFSVRTELNEFDYYTIFTKPNEKTINTLKNNTNCIEMYRNQLPTEL